MENEAMKEENKNEELPEEPAIETEQNQDEAEFRYLLIQAVFDGVLRPTHAIYLFCRKYGIRSLTLTDLDCPLRPRPPVVELFDSLLAGDGYEMARLLDVLDQERRAGRLS